MRTRRPCPAPVARSAFAGFRFPPDVIVLAVRWYLRFSLMPLCQGRRGRGQGVEDERVEFSRQGWLHPPQDLFSAVAHGGALGRIGAAAWFVHEAIVGDGHSALLAARSPPRFSRCRMVLPEDAWTGWRRTWRRRRPGCATGRGCRRR